MTKDHYDMNFGTNKAPIEVIKEGAFGETYFRDIYFGINGKWYNKSWKNLDELKNVDKKYVCSNFYDISINIYKVKHGTSLRFWENKGWINSIDPYGWFQWYFKYWLDRRYLDDERQTARWYGIIRRFKGKLGKRSKILLIDLIIIYFISNQTSFIALGL